MRKGDNMNELTSFAEEIFSSPTFEIFSPPSVGDLQAGGTGEDGGQPAGHHLRPAGPYQHDDRHLGRPPVLRLGSGSHFSRQSGNLRKYFLMFLILLLGQV